MYGLGDLNCISIIITGTILCKMAKRKDYVLLLYFIKKTKVLVFFVRKLDVLSFLDIVL